MADSKITGLTELTSLAPADLFPVVDDVAGTPITKKITAANVLALAYPVGSIYISTASTNPNTLFGFGTWSAFGAGRTLVSLDSGQTEFDTVEETGGAKTVTLDVTMIPSHTHTQNSHTHTLATGTGSTGNFSQVIGTVDTSSGGTGGTPTQTALGTISGSTTATNQNTGGGGAHNNLQPYIVVYMFKRTA